MTFVLLHSSKRTKRLVRNKALCQTQLLQLIFFYRCFIVPYFGAFACLFIEDSPDAGIGEKKSPLAVFRTMNSQFRFVYYCEILNTVKLI